MTSVQPLSFAPPARLVGQAEMTTLPAENRAPVRVDVGRLRPGASLRDRPIDTDHVERLAATGGEWPPLLVRASDLVVIDGLHRLAAAMRLQLGTTTVTLFDGSTEDALVAAIRTNVAHGLPLTVSERKNAALQLLGRHQEWSDRMVAGICGLAASTVRQLREPQSEQPVATIVQLTRRLGRDGRARPLDRTELRRQIIDALHQDPTASLRIIAARTGASPATVRAVRQRLAEPPDPAPVDGGRKYDGSASGAGSQWSVDSACSSAEGPREFAVWFDHTRIDAHSCSLHAANVPLSRVYEVADESLRRAKLWAEFAATLQSRPAETGRHR